MDLPLPIIDCPPAVVTRDYTATNAAFFNTIGQLRPIVAPGASGSKAPITDVPICSVCKMRLLALGSKIKATASFNRPPITSSEVFFVEGDELFERLSDRLRLVV